LLAAFAVGGCVKDLSDVSARSSRRERKKKKKKKKKKQKNSIIKYLLLLAIFIASFFNFLFSPAFNSSCVDRCRRA